jgi:hypothetical protein
MIILLVKEERPLQFFATCGLMLALASVGIAAPVICTYMQTGLVPRFPTAVLATGMMLLSFVAIFCGLILDSVARGRKEMKRIAYLAFPAIASRPPEKLLT